jgi:hypothetical protein
MKRALLLLLAGVFLMGAPSRDRVAKALESSSRREAQQRIPGGLSAAEWDALNAETDAWQRGQPDGMLTVLELGAKRAAGQISAREHNESMDILQGAVPPRRRR